MEIKERKERLRQEQFLTIVKENSDAFYRYAYSVLLNEQDAEDAVGETVTKAFEHINELRSVQKMRSWMFQILANSCKTLLAKRRGRSDIPITDAFPEDSENNPNQETSMDLRDCIFRMDAKFREIVILYYYEGLKVKEIARILKVSEGTVKSRLSRARDQLKTYLQ